MTAEMAKNNRMSIEELEKVQQQKLRLLLKHSHKTSAYYNDAFKGFDLDRVELNQLPVLTKSLLMNRFDDIVTDPVLKLHKLRAWLADPNTLTKLYKDRWLVFQSSGSTGEPVVIVQDLPQIFRYQAVVVSRNPVKRPNLWQAIKILGGGLFKPLRFAAITLTSGRGSSGYVASFQMPKPPFFLQHRFLNVLDPLDKLVSQLNDFQPLGLLTTPVMLDSLANEQLAGRLRLNLNGPMASLTTGGETLYEATRRKARKAWNLEIQNIYGATECGIIAKSCCDFEHMHLMSDLCLLEVVDNQNNPVPHGSLGSKVLMTNLNNFDQPLIRYEMNDVVGFSAENHDCGLPFPLIKSLEGRSDQNFVLEDTNGEQIPVRHEHFLVFDEVTSMRRFQLTQVGRNSFRLKYALTKGHPTGPTEAQTLIRSCLNKLDFPVKIDVVLEEVEDFPMGPAGKFRMFDNQYT